MYAHIFFNFYHLLIICYDLYLHLFSLLIFYSIFIFLFFRFHSFIHTQSIFLLLFSLFDISLTLSFYVSFFYSLSIFYLTLYLYLYIYIYIYIPFSLSLFLSLSFFFFFISSRSSPILLSRPRASANAMRCCSSHRQTLHQSYPRRWPATTNSAWLICASTTAEAKRTQSSRCTACTNDWERKKRKEKETEASAGTAKATKGTAEVIADRVEHKGARITQGTVTTTSLSRLCVWCVCCLFWFYLFYSFVWLIRSPALLLASSCALFGGSSRDILHKIVHIMISVWVNNNKIIILIK